MSETNGAAMGAEDTPLVLATPPPAKVASSPSPSGNNLAPPCSAAKASSPASAHSKLGSAASQESANSEPPPSLSPSTPASLRISGATSAGLAKTPVASSTSSATALAHSVPEMDVDMDLDLPYRPLRSFLQPENSYDSGSSANPSCFLGSHESVRSERIPSSSGGLAVGQMAVLAARPRSGGPVVRQQSHPESCLNLCSYHHHHAHCHAHLHCGGGTTTAPGGVPHHSPGGHETTHLRHSQTLHPSGFGGCGEGIANIAADTLRINGALKQFKQVGK